MDKAHGIRAIPRPSKPDDPDPVAEVVREIEAATHRALRRLAVAILAIVVLVLGVLLGVGVPLPLVGVVAGLAVLAAVVPSPWRSR